ncbi:MAG TPA: hypothetical protein VHB79_22105 [Polyangiaceae bacterium]|nr:hypothetical protein [Polyangiaceae bacterium]
MSLRWLACLLPLLGLGCTVNATAQKDRRQHNTCNVDSDCSNNHCSSGICQEVNGTLESLLVTVTPPSGSNLPQLNFVSQLENVPTSGGSLDLTPPAAHHVSGTLSLAKGVSCYPTFLDENDEPLKLRAPDGKSLPVDITLSLRERPLGLPQQQYFDSASTLDKLSVKLGSYPFELTVPGGHYDIYAATPPYQEQDCAVPPQLWRDFVLEGPDAELALAPGPITDLTVTLHWPGGDHAGDLMGWLADIIEPLDGNRLSTVAKLGAPVGSSAMVEYDVQLRYSPAIESSESKAAVGSDLLRLRPPASVTAPTIYWDLSALQLFDPKHPDITGFSKLPAPVKVQGLLTRQDTNAPIPGYVFLISQKISGVDAGIFASYKTTFEVGADGVIDLELPPGNYRVQGMPGTRVGMNDDSLDSIGSLRTVWPIAATPSQQFGKTLELPAIAQLTGQSPMPGAEVQAVPVAAHIGEFAAVFGDTRSTASSDDGDGVPDPSLPTVLSPRSTTGTVDASGHFTVQADLGLFNVSVRGPESLGFAWFVRPGVVVTGDNQDLGHLVLPRPTVLSGSCLVGLVSGNSVPAPAATIRAYAYLDKDLAYTRDRSQARTVIQVAETRADDSGAYRLLIPPSLAH